MKEINLTDLNDAQLNALRARIDCILKERRNKEKMVAIANFKKAFEDLGKLGVEVYYSEYDDERIELLSLDYFEFTT